MWMLHICAVVFTFMIVALVLSAGEGEPNKCYCRIICAAVLFLMLLLDLAVLNII